MQNTRRNTLVFVQGLPKRLRAFPQHSGLATRMVPGGCHGCPLPDSREGAGEGPARHSCVPGQPCPSSRPCWPAEKVEQALGCVQGFEEEALSSPEQ